MADATSAPAPKPLAAAGSGELAATGAG